MDLFVIDTGGDSGLLKKTEIFPIDVGGGDIVVNDIKSECCSNVTNGVDKHEKSDSKTNKRLQQYNFNRPNTNFPKKSSSIAAVSLPPRTTTTTISTPTTCTSNSNWKLNTSYLDDLVEDLDYMKTNVQKELKNCVLNGIEDKDLSTKNRFQLKKMKKEERSQNKGKDWFNMRAPEMTEELKRDVEIIQMRSVLDRKHFYKKNDFKVLPKFFQIGKVLSSPLDYYNERGPSNSKKSKTIVDELLDDADFQKYNKRKYNEIMLKKQKTGLHKANQKMKRLKKNKK